jgi:hypothetical protein
MPRSGDRRKLPARLSGAISHNLSLYALAAGAAGVQLLALAQPSEAEVVYTSAHKPIGRNQTYSFDLNHDGIKDFTIENVFGQGSAGSTFKMVILPDAGGAIAYRLTSPHEDLAVVFHKGGAIGIGEHFHPQGAATMAARAELFGDWFSYGNWFNVRDGYLGLSFRIDGQVHYGWARLNVLSNSRFRILAILTGYAYETQPDTPIIAGDTGGAADEESQAEPMSGVPQQKEGQPAPTLGALSLGAPGLAIWRRETS